MFTRLTVRRARDRLHAALQFKNKEMAYICDCGKALDLVAMLDALPRNGTGNSGMVYNKCAGCGAPMEFRLANGRMEVGYSYFGALPLTICCWRGGISFICAVLPRR